MTTRKSDRRGEFARRGVKGVGQRRLGTARGVGDAHAEGQRAVRDRLADAAHADDAQPRARHLARQRHRAGGPLALAHILIGLRQPARDVEHQRQRQVGDVVVEHVGRVPDHHAAGLGRGDVHTVVAHAHDRDDLQCRQLVDQVGADLGLAAAADRTDLGRQPRQGGRVGLVQTVVHREGGLQRFQQEGRQPRDGQQVGFVGHGSNSAKLCDDRTIAHPDPTLRTP